MRELFDHESHLIFVVFDWATETLCFGQEVYSVIASAVCKWRVFNPFPVGTVFPCGTCLYCRFKHSRFSVSPVPLW